MLNPKIANNDERVMAFIKGLSLSSPWIEGLLSRYKPTKQRIFLDAVHLIDDLMNINVFYK